MKQITLALLVALCALASPYAQTPPAQSRVTGTITLALDVRETPRKLLHARETLAVTPGALTLVYPKWIPGEHAPDGPIDDLVALTFTSGGRSIPWRRDPVDLFAFHVDVPPGVTTLDVSFDFLSAIGQGGFSSASSETAHLGIYSWNQVLLYPRGTRTDEVMIRASMELPAAWKFGTALSVANQNGAKVDFQPVSLTTLVDSPVIAGEYLRVVPLDGSSRPVEAALVGDTAASVEIPNDLTAKWKRLVQEADAMFGARHYNNYHFLLTLSDHVAHFGLEHHQSNDSRVPENSLTQQNSIGVVAHEYVHSWNGKYRRPAGLVSGVSADYQAPVDSRLLWVYEGLTEYWGDVLGGRSGIRSPELYRENVAVIAGNMARQAGRAWRPLEDTATAAQLLYFGRPEWASWRRGVDFYPESELVWLEVDSVIRQKTGGKKSLDDFAHAFHGAPGGAPAVKPYSFDDVVAALQAVAPNDWAGFFRERIVDVAPAPPFRGIEASGWRVVYGETKPDLVRAGEEESDVFDFWQSLGIVVKGDGTSGDAADGIIRDVVPGMPAAEAGVGPAMRLVAVNGRRYSAKGLLEALREAKAGSAPIELLVENVDTFKTCRVDYHGGEKYPHLERDASKPDLLTPIGSAKAPPAK